jgi:hypothetical protein
MKRLFGEQAVDHPQAAEHCAPHNQRIQQPIPSASKPAPGLAADRQHLAQPEMAFYGTPTKGRGHLDERGTLLSC